MERVVVLGDEKSTRDLVASAFEDQGIETTTVEYRDETAVGLPTAPFLLVILCLTHIEKATQRPLLCSLGAATDAPIVLASVPPNLDMALHAIRLGAFDLLLLPPTREAVADLLVRARLYRQKMVLRKLEVVVPLSRWFAHEVRNPLSGMLSGAQLLLERSPSSSHAERYIKIIVEEGNRLEQFLRRLTEFGRSARGPFVPAILNAVVERVLASAGPRLKEQGIQLRCRFDPLLPKVRIDMTLMELAIGRIIASAIEAMPEGGVMTVSTCCRPEKRMVELTVSDANLAAARDREQQFSNLLISPRMKETELGLVFAVQVFAEHGGDLSFHADPGSGGNILAQLPLNGQQEK